MPIPYVAAGESPPPLPSRSLLPAAAAVWLELEPDGDVLGLVSELSVGDGPDPCDVVVGLAGCDEDPGVDERVLVDENLVEVAVSACVAEDLDVAEVVAADDVEVFDKILLTVAVVALVGSPRAFSHVSLPVLETSVMAPPDT